ncbi:V-type ATP synthase subunit F [Ruminococcus sp. CLA-AA-H200]|uniref:V-type ATP synthase subunit F n=1 Tax=Ruminococcus turbiniformis TaxID=2881258 RepID=A0ABS8FSI3_9FIRM|nr:V-type ATP synthase subunit F [Ruminococcus turbiniformis]MCC2252995.1 V-type ATP synthase subunit F [Ruminococcus turbiniformis]
MYKIAVIGDYDSIYGFATLGLDICPVKTRDEIREKLRRLAESGYGIIYITEAAAAEAGDELEMLRGRTLPAVIQIPGVSGNTGAGVEGVKKTVEQAVGSDILFGGVNE